MPEEVKSFYVKEDMLRVYVVRNKEDSVRFKIQDDTKHEGLRLSIKTVSKEWKVKRYCRNAHRLYRTNPVKMGSLGLYSRLKSKSEATNETTIYSQLEAKSEAGNETTIYSRLGTQSEAGKKTTIHSQLESSDELAAITHGLVVQKEMPVFYKPANSQDLVNLGNCIWPEPHQDRDRVSMNDVAVVKITNQSRIEELREVYQSGRQLRVYSGDRESLQDVKVFKIGASSGLTHGYVRIPKLTVKLDDQVFDGIIIQAEESDDEYCTGGDSGAASMSVDPSDDKMLDAISLVFSNWNLDEDDIRNAVLTTSISEGVKKFEEQTHTRVIIDDAFGLH